MPVKMLSQTQYHKGHLSNVMLWWSFVLFVFAAITLSPMVINLNLALAHSTTQALLASSPAQSTAFENLIEINTGDQKTFASILSLKVSPDATPVDTSNMALLDVIVGDLTEFDFETDTEATDTWGTVLRITLEGDHLPHPNVTLRSRIVKVRSAPPRASPPARLNNKHGER